jgi:hypothetical protein
MAGLALQIAGYNLQLSVLSSNLQVSFREYLKIHCCKKVVQPYHYCIQGIIVINSSTWRPQFTFVTELSVRLRHLNTCADGVVGLNKNLMPLQLTAWLIKYGATSASCVIQDLAYFLQFSVPNKIWLLSKVPLQLPAFISILTRQPLPATLHYNTFMGYIEHKHIYMLNVLLIVRHSISV